MNGGILALNLGSSSLKAVLFAPGGERRFHYAVHGEADSALAALLNEIGNTPLAAIGHRIVHGGTAPEPARLLDAAELARLDALAPLAPLHMPPALRLVWQSAQRYSSTPQYGCYDTAFHRSLPPLARRLPLPVPTGIERYGFHGLSYAYIARQLPQHLENADTLRIAVAHLGAGTSLCLLENLRSTDTSMGLTPLGGLPMATRSGDLDPGVVLELARRLGIDAAEQILYRQSGLLALSGGLHGDMAALLASADETAHFAVDFFARAVRGGLGALAAKAGGLDALVFTGGIGARAPAVRAAICDGLQCLGFVLNPVANAENARILNAPSSQPVLCLVTDEEAMIHDYVAMKLAG